MNNLTKNIAIWLIIAVVLMTVFNQFGAQRNAQTQMPYSQFIEEVRSQQINKVVIEGNVLRGEGPGVTVTVGLPGKAFDAAGTGMLAAATAGTEAFGWGV